MKDPYSVLGVSPDDSDADIKKAYRELARKYHPDNYQDNPLADLAEEKMKEINEAYDAIQKQRSGGGNSSTYQRGDYTQQTYTSGGSSNPTYAKVRSCINSGDLGTAERLLLEVPNRDAEYYFLSGSIAYRKGWMDEALQNFTRAVQMAPNNMEYRQALGLLQRQAGYRPAGYGGTGMDAMDCCTTMMCLNCLCGGGRC